MYVKDFGYTTRLAFLTKVIGLMIVTHCVVVFGIGITTFGIAYDGDTRRLDTWFYWRWSTQCIGVFALVSMYWLRYNNWANWRYWIQLIICFVSAAWSAVFIGYGIRDWISCDVYTNCIGQQPLGVPWKFSDVTSVDILFLCVFFLAAANMIWSALYCIIGFYLRNKINLRLALAAAHSKIASNPNSELLTMGVYGGGAPAGGGAFITCELEDHVPQLPPLIQSELDGAVLQSYYIKSHMDDEATYVDPKDVEEIRYMINQCGDRNIELVAGPHVSTLGTVTWLSSFFTVPHVPIVYTTKVQRPF